MNTTTANGDTQRTFFQKYGNAITVGLWVIALSSHAILLPKLIREFFKKND